jgi:hypothetical protein
MAILYWQGSTAGAGVNRFNFNYGPNWKVWRPASTATWLTSATGPVANDTVYVGEVFVARSPILYGGASGSVALTSWSTGVTGTTFNSSINSFSANLVQQGGLTPGSNNTNWYPFPYLGGGITGDIYIYCANVLNLDVSELAGATATRAEAGLKLKVKDQVTIKTTGQVDENYNVGGQDGNGYPNYSVVDINFIPSKGYNNGGTAASNTNLYLQGGQLWEGRRPSSTVGLGNVTIRGGLFRFGSVDAGLSGAGLSGTTPRPYRVDLIQTAIGTFNTHNGDINCDPSCTFGTFSVRSGSNPYYNVNERAYGLDGNEIIVAGTFNSNTVNSLLGWDALSASGPFNSGIFLYDQYTSLPGVEGYDYEPNILVSNPEDGVTLSANVFQVFTEVGPYSTTTNGNAQRPWNVMFFGSANITSMSVEGAKIKAWQKLPTDKSISITNLQMSENSQLDLVYGSQFDNWYFGSLTGTSITGANTVIGGINFADDTCTIKGSAGVRLYNTKIVNNFDFRAATKVPQTFSVLETLSEDKFGGIGGAFRG